MTSSLNNYPPQPLSDSDTDSDGGDPSSTSLRRHSDLSDSIFKSYFQFTGHSSSATASPSDLSKIQSFLTSSSSGALSCLICLERIKPSDPTWSCSSLCFSIFHLICIQSWAQQSSNLFASRASTRLPISPETASETAIWNCPKCRVEYPKSQIPKGYFCFCGKLKDPYSDDPWVLPHSCGDVCEKPLMNNCGHRCLLLCHPGPCPACPKLVKVRCFCGSNDDVRRCGFKEYSCNNQCSKLLDCGVHECVEICHIGDCPPCRKIGVYRCQCGKKNEERECFNRVYRCEEPCEKKLRCGKHVCERGCHYGECGECPLQGKRTCPCGKRVYEGLPCDVPVQVCGDTCGKMLSCGYHRCPERCHRGQCAETCRTVVKKWCRCGSHRKDVPCCQDLVCERKCLTMRDCGRHACKRRCCDGDCPPCSEICGRRLRCKNHKCPSPCHSGACAPCPITVTISCACGETHFEVPCGTEKDQKPPKCPKRCHIAPLCRHALKCKPHKCHYGACPPCRLPCDEEYPCGHACKLRCHGAKPPPNPEFTLKPKKKKIIQNESVPGTPCPSCPELVWRSCVGQHIGTERMMVCSNKSQFSCENLCGNPLPCGNHYCTKTCHALESKSSVNQLHRSEPCEDCFLSCQKEREPRCQHHCPRPCHPGDCPPCKVLIKRSCHCGSMVHVFECIYYNTLSAKDQEAVRSCGGPCHRKLPNCTHLCPETCHPGQCPNPEKCCKKVTVRCKCQTLKKEWLCKDVQAAYLRNDCDSSDIPKNQFGAGLIPCNSECKIKVQVAESELQLRKSRVTEVKEPDNEKLVPKRRKRRERVLESTETSKLQKIISRTKQLLLYVFILVILLVASYYGYEGLLRLNDWMNEVDEQRQRYSRTK
ncbi:PREDICTED: NF-X1-type zinc finger protein NFXL2 [Lupinus angustifolius]|uniref:NF-X1-type zinc finger protein NFXL2 n=1 Tax=Lupinus angustifolius TaxID=3871 RepID=UPI00092F5C94|nr:PREDICTED: NF-X1-type zinc finger protein NFXL2 [Lupinus angustifolius]